MSLGEPAKQARRDGGELAAMSEVCLSHRPPFVAHRSLTLPRPRHFPPLHGGKSENGGIIRSGP